MSGHLVLHLGLLTTDCVFQFSALFKPYYCVLKNDNEEMVIYWLIASHAACVLLALGFEIS
jgi:hypothetical protein